MVILAPPTDDSNDSLEPLEIGRCIICHVFGNSGNYHFKSALHSHDKSVKIFLTMMNGFASIIFSVWLLA